MISVCLKLPRFTRDTQVLKTLRSVAQLADAGLLPSFTENGGKRRCLDAVADRYSVAITPEMLGRIDLDDISVDPVALQFVPDVRELDQSENALSDPIGDNAHSPLKGLVHRYRDRVLIKATEQCPVYCRFCFRRESVGANAEKPLSNDDFDAIFSYLENQPEVWEVIISGGDPLVLSDARLRSLMEGLARVAHLKVVRIHTRVPVVNSQRVTDELLQILRSCNKTLYVAIHANHAQEFSKAARGALAKIADAGIPMISQTVLLRNVNDSEETLGELMRTFVELRVTPYYLHQLDLAPGTEHFRVPISRGQALLRSLRGTWSGLCQPNYVIDLPGGYGKVPVGPNYVDSSSADETLIITDPNGGSHCYPHDQ